MADAKYIEGRRPDGGRIYSPEYHAWRHMIQRCTMPQTCTYKSHGARGIRVCEEWMNSFSAFLQYVGPRPEGIMPSGKVAAYSLDRFPDNDGNYEPGNVRWATWDQQANNRRPKPPKHKLPRRPTASRFLGVSRLPHRGIWLAKVAMQYVGTFKDECDAATAYNFAALECLGGRAKYNMPTGRPTSPTSRYY